MSDNPQTLMFSATLPGWIHKMIKKYLREDSVLLDLVGRDSVRTSTTVEVCVIYCRLDDRLAFDPAFLLRPRPY